MICVPRKTFFKSFVKRIKENKSNDDLKNNVIMPILRGIFRTIN